MSEGGYRRYVALGDSQTEGLWDGDDHRGLIGFADRLALQLDSARPGLEYANLAVRGKRIGEVIAEQLDPALAMHPDLVTVVVGMNDVIRPGRAFERSLSDLRYLYARLAESGATVATTTFPDATRILPIGRLLSARLGRINAEIRRAATRYGLRLVDLYDAESMLDPATWSIDRMHASPHGHQLFAAAAAESLGLPDSSHDWAVRTRPQHDHSARTARLEAQIHWTHHMLLPWVVRHARGRSSGDGRLPKRPLMSPIDPW